MMFYTYRKVLVIASLVFCLFSSVFAYSGGSGEPNDPYQIATVSDWNDLMNTTTDLDKCFIMTADVNLQGVALTPVGNPDTPFTGVFDGNGHIIRDATINIPGSYYIGLFASVSSGGQIRNLGAEDVNIIGGNYVGGLAGISAGNITNCYVTGAVTGGGNYVGGLIGSNSGRITACYTTGTASGGGNCIGGLAGWNNGDIIDCYSTDAVNGAIQVGGLIGYNNSIVTNCYVTGNIIGSGSYVGGLAGMSGGNINNCYVTGVVTGGGAYVGGLIGSNSGSITACYTTGTASGGGNYIGGLAGENYGGIITDCYSTDAVSGTSQVGGLIGYNNSIIIDCYTTGAVSGGGTGGLVGQNDGGNINACFWDVDTSGQTTSAGGIGLITSQMKSVTTYQNAGWGSYNSWVINDGVDYPHFAWENTGGIPIPEPPPIPLPGSGTEQDPYQISTIDDFNLLYQYISVLDKHIILMADLDLSGITLNPIGYNMKPFTGTFDGNGHTIWNVNINMPGNNYIGLFSFVIPGGQIRNLCIEDITVIGGNYVGGLAGGNDGNITNCCVTGAVTQGSNYVGGLVGENVGSINACYTTGTVSGSGNYVGGLAGTSGGNITNCYVTGVVNGGGYCVGGLVGEDVGSINACYTTGTASGGGNCVGGLSGSNYGGIVTNCYSIDAVNGAGQVGGLIGYNISAITDCYATGAVTGGGYIGGMVGQNDGGNITACFWDVNTSGWSTSAGGTGKTTAEMKTLSTFTSAGWDFVGETANGTDDIWEIYGGFSYPLFAGQPVTTVPNVTGMTATDAITAIAEANLVAGITTAYSGTVSIGNVIKQNPTTGTITAKGSTVIIVVSLGVKYSGGNGTADDPYLISTAEDMNQIGQNYTDWAKCFKLTADLDLEGIELKPIGNDSDYVYYFRGVFDGNGHTIRNLKFDTNDSMIGLFGFIREGVVQNVNLEGIDIKAGSYVGGIAARGSFGLIQNCHVSGLIAGQELCGGITGFWSGGTIRNCSFKGQVSGTWSTGGIAGYTEAEITKCYAIAEIIGEIGCGGIVGSNEGGNFESCFAKGTVTGSYCTGGFAGSTGDHCEGGGIIRNCYTDVIVNCSNAAGGFSGSGPAHGQIWNCYSSGKVIYDVNNYSDVGGFIGEYARYGVYNSYFLETSGPDNGFGEPLSEEQMKQQASFIGWDFSYTDGNEAEWFMQIDEYPILVWQISPADLYTDGRNNFRDFAVFAQYWMRNDCRMYNDYCDWADLNFDGSVNYDDLIEFMSYWLEEGIY